ncbi:hypothetical protein [Spirillospora sp. NPDC029432]|uniref:hypothetical protein n=1 Tax=Spirillospora sp. NPDC029432 TaxID=3154599 RepID=UPI0034520DCB
MAKTAGALKAHSDELTADQFFELAPDQGTLRVVNPAPVGIVTRAMALYAAQCAFREAGAPSTLVDRLSVPAPGEQNVWWTGFTGAWESDEVRGFRARVTAAR